MFYFYSLALLASVWRYKQFSSLALTTLVVLVSNLSMLQLRDPLLLLARSYPDHKWQIWFGVWSLANLAVISLLYYSHRRINLNTTRVSSIVGFHFVALCAVQCMGYVDETYIQSTTLDLIYRFGIPSINISIGLTIFGFLLGSDKYARFARFSSNT